MNRDEALYALGLSQHGQPSDVERAYTETRSRLEALQSGAPTDALRAKYRGELEELERARQAVLDGPPASLGVPALSPTMMRDLPGASPSFTEGGESNEPAGARVALQQGRVLAGRFEVRRRLGAGGMGAVFAAFDRNRRAEVALKVLLPGLLTNTQARDRFLAEATLALKLIHQNIRTVFDVQHEGELHFLVMELLEGETLRERIERNKKEGRVFSVDEVLAIARPLCEALRYAHKVTVHRDIKPENIWLARDGQVKLLDFGIARLLSTSQLTMTGMSLGTAYYMAPEQHKGAGNVDGRADQYALAVVLYELLAGDVPTGRFRPVKDVRSDVPVSLSDAIDRALASEAIERFPDVATFATALEQLGAGKAGSHKRLVARGPLPPAFWTTRGARGALGVGAVLLMVGSLFFRTELMHSWRAMTRDEVLQKQAESKLLELRGLIDSSSGLVALAGLTEPPALVTAREQHGLAQAAIERLDDGAALQSAEEAARALEKWFNEDGEVQTKAAKGLPKLRGELDGALALARKVLPADEVSRAAAVIEGSAALSDQGPAAAVSERVRRATSALQQLMNQRKEDLVAPATQLKGEVDSLYESVYRDWPSKYKTEITAASKDEPLQEAWKTLRQICERVYWSSTQKAEIEGRKLAADGQVRDNPAAALRDLGGLRQELLAQLSEIESAPELVELNLRHRPSGETINTSFASGEVLQAALDRARSEESEGRFTAAAEALRTVNELRPRYQASMTELVELNLRHRPSGETIETSIPAGAALQAALDRARDEESAGRSAAAVEVLRTVDGLRAQYQASTAEIRRVQGLRALNETVFVPIQGGEFTLGNTIEANERDYAHRVVVSSFEMSRYEVTQHLYESVTGVNPSQESIGPDLPVTVSWEDAAAFCEKASELLGTKWRLPTEAEWEFACRAGSTTRYCYGDDVRRLKDYAWYLANSGDISLPDGEDARGVDLGCRVHSVGELKPNAWGLFDMHGNVSEWCSDWYASLWFKSQVGIPVDPVGPSSGKGRVVRGGSFDGNVSSVYDPCHSAHRWWKSPMEEEDSLAGFRVVKSGAPQSQPVAGVSGEARAKEALRRIEFCPVPAGSFARHSSLTFQLEGFQMGKYEITQLQYTEVMGLVPFALARGADLPVTHISWDDAVAFCERASALTGDAWRLPTSAEWEYACRAGTTTDYCFGDDKLQLKEYGWYFINSGDRQLRADTEWDVDKIQDGEGWNVKMHPVGRLEPNAWGLFDMHGNVAEICSDWYFPNHADKRTGVLVNPKAPPNSGDWRAAHGGSYRWDAEHLDSSNQQMHSPGLPRPDQGFRAVKAISKSR